MTSEINNKTIIDTNFKLPIEYLEDKDIHTLSDNVCNDLELENLNSENNSDHLCDIDQKPIYHHLFTPDHIFASQLIKKWKLKFTTNVKFLQDTQSIIKNSDKYKSYLNTFDENNDPNNLLTIWENTKNNQFFHEKYNYLDWKMFKHLNESSSFLQILSVIHLFSPILTLLLPFLMLLFPFIILKIQGIPISVDMYINTLKSVAKHHVIGKVLDNIQGMSFDRLFYLCFSIGIYIFQIYQNINLCKKFYANIISINYDIMNLKTHINYSIESISQFITINNDMSSYQPFFDNSQLYLENLKLLYNDICNITPFQVSYNKFSQIGTMLRIYYLIYSNQQYEDAIKYSVGFMGYVNNICNLHTHLNNSLISTCEFTKNDSACYFNQQYYPAIIDSEPVCNDTDVSKNIIISAPNKAGKTTLIKTTLINIILSQQIGCGFYKHARLTPYNHIHSYLNIPDTSARDSLFQAESRRCKDIIDCIKDNDKSDRHFCIFDELYSGTNPDEATSAGNAFLKYIEQFDNVNFILTTHYKDICKKFKKSKTIVNYKMDVNINENGSFNYTYKLVKGISSIKGGIRVLKDMGYPDEIINDIEMKE
jgi:hypothetical protein